MEETPPPNRQHRETAEERRARHASFLRRSRQYAATYKVNCVAMNRIANPGEGVRRKADIATAKQLAGVLPPGALVEKGSPPATIGAMRDCRPRQIMPSPDDATAAEDPAVGLTCRHDADGGRPGTTAKCPATR